MKSQKLRYTLIIFLLAPVFQLYAQSIGGVINTYYQVIEVVPSKSCVRVTGTSGLAQYDNTMLLQMKGATVNTANNSSYGSVTAINNAGNYEMGVICGISGDSVFFQQTLLNSYDVSGKVQLVRVPSYASATVTSPLLPGTWNNATGTGAVVALIAVNTLTLNAAVSADTIGFKGGPVVILNGSCGVFLVYSDYAYDPATSTGGSYKGEGIADVTAANSGGRGPMANGGGGGGDHNNGAGGGGNLTAGGSGGNNSSTAGCNNKFPGLGGHALSNTGNKIYPGGGGGHGHSNNTVTAYGGGNGGGIVYLQAGTLAGNNFTVSASGRPGADNIGDGGSGGGAGGTIIMNVGSYSGNVNVIANGGKGGDVDNLSLSNRSMGPGAGGAGGAVYFTGGMPAVTVSVSGGAAGTSYNTSPAGLTGNNGATAGSNGTSTAGYSVSRSGAPAAYCSALLLPLTLVYFDGIREGSSARLYWKTAQTELVKTFSIEYSPDGNTWTTLEEIAAGGNGAVACSRPEPLPGRALNYYRLKITGLNEDLVYSPATCIKSSPGAGYMTVYPNPAGQAIGLHTSLKGWQTLHLYSADGKLVWSNPYWLQTNTENIPLPSLQPGIYILSAGGLKSRLFVR